MDLFDLMAKAAVHVSFSSQVYKPTFCTCIWPALAYYIDFMMTSILISLVISIRVVSEWYDYYYYYYVLDFPKWHSLMCAYRASMHFGEIPKCSHPLQYAIFLDLVSRSKKSICGSRNHSVYQRRKSWNCNTTLKLAESRSFIQQSQR